VASGLAFVSAQVGIVELNRVCAEMRARNLELFEALGGWVATTSDGELQRLFAEACHRHAWHAELWERRLPMIPVAGATAAPPVVATGDTAEGEDTAEDDEARRRSYRGRLVALDEDLQRLRARIDPTLDPSSARTIDLVGRDVAELISRLESRRSR